MRERGGEAPLKVFLIVRIRPSSYAGITVSAQLRADVGTTADVGSVEHLSQRRTHTRIVWPLAAVEGVCKDLGWLRVSEYAVNRCSCYVDPFDCCIG